jgi:hypothetical protein
MTRGWPGVWSHKQVVDGGSPLDEGAGLDDFCSCVQELGGGDWRGNLQGTAIQREMVPSVPSVLR